MAISRCDAARISQTALSGALCLIPIFFLFAFRDPFIVPKFLAAAGVSAAVLSVVLWSNGVCVLRSRLDAPLAAFVVAVLLSAVFSVDGWLSVVGPDHSYLAALPGVALCISGFYAGRASAAIGADDFLDSLSFWTVAGAVPVSLIALGEIVLGVSLAGPNSYSGRAISSFGAPTYLASYLALVLPFAYRESISKFGNRKGLGVSVLTLGALALFATGSRAGIFAAVAGVAIASWCSRPRSSKAWRVAFLASLAVILLCVVGLNLFARSGDSTRFRAWGMAAEQWRETPVFGSGPGTFTLTFRIRTTIDLMRESGGWISFPHAHNDWFEVLSSLGAVGLVAFAWLHWRGLLAGKAALKRMKKGDRSIPAAVIGAMVAILLMWKFNFPALIVAWILALWAGTLFAPDEKARFPLAVTATIVGIVSLFVIGFSVWNASADRLNVLGRRARAEGRPREAAVYFSKAIHRNPGKIGYRLDLLNTLWDSAGDSPEVLAVASAYAADGIQNRPVEPEMHRMLGVSEMKRGRFVRARIALESAVMLAPAMGSALEDLAEVALLQGDAVRHRELKERLEGLGRRD